LFVIAEIRTLQVEAGSDVPSSNPEAISFKEPCQATWSCITIGKPNEARAAALDIPLQNTGRVKGSDVFSHHSADVPHVMPGHPQVLP
jgi:hypothetical protein